MSKDVFVNRLLNLKKIKYIGLDLDHTLVRYHSEEFESLVYKLLIERLIEVKSYPATIKELTFSYDNAIRGLVIDRKKGNILKLSRFGAIRASFHGTSRIEFDEQKKIYHSMYVDLSHPDYESIDTSFSISFCVLFSQLVDLRDKHPHDFPTYDEIASDISFCLDRLHKDKSLKTIVMKDLPRYIIKDEEVVKGLLRYKFHGKKIFVLTNSEYYYAKTLMEYTIDPFLPDGQKWHDLFEIVITTSQKPRFFFDNLKFLKINLEDEKMTNLEGPISPGVYQGGCANQFTRDLGLSGDEILYIGDHIYGDVLRLKKDCNWRTALVVEELEEEIENLGEAAPFSQRIKSLMEKKEPLEEKHVSLLSQKIEEASDKYDTEIQKLQKDLSELDQEISKLIKQQEACFNPSWGRVFRTGAEESLFANQVVRFACIYMSKLSDLVRCSPRTYFRAKQRPLPHELTISSDDVYS